MSPPAYYRYWGKARPADDSTSPFHLLPYHSLDVAAVGAAWWSQSRALRHGLQAALKNSQQGGECLQPWLLFFVALHDLGKFDVRFQMKAMSALGTLNPQWTSSDLPLQGDADRYDHGQEGLFWLVRDLAQYTGAAETLDSQLDAWLPWMSAVAGHHGRVTRRRLRATPPDAEQFVVDSDRTARSDWVKALERVFLTPAGLSIHDAPPRIGGAGVQFLAGLCSICDWIGSNQDWFAYRHREPPAPTDYDADLVNHFESRGERIAELNLLRHCGLLRDALPYLGIQALLKEGESPRQLQTIVDGLPVESGLTIVEAPTGSGKTEAALGYAWRLLEAGLAEGIVFALPTQATANAMWDRLNLFADKLFGAGTNVVLAHGKARWHSGHGALVAASRQSSAQGKEDIRVQCASWLAESRKRVFLGQLGICTIDQVLLSVLPLRHKFVRGFGVMKSVLIVDEVHAYDQYMYGLLDSVLRQQQDVGGSAVVLSATLSSGQRSKLAEAWQAGVMPQAAAAYPLVTHVDEHGSAASFVIADASQCPPERRVRVESLPLPALFPDETLLSRVLAAAGGGARVAIVCNLVQDAQQLAHALRERATLPVDLFHARYRYSDRQEREKDVRDQYGRAADRNGGRVLVATQVVEQSLDLDFDWLVTQLCPIDLLFQRIGRLHRHPRPRPAGFENAQCAVMVPADNRYGLHKVIYGYTRVLWRTQQLLDENREIVFPAAYRDWIERVYERDDWPEEAADISLDAEKFRVSEKATFDLARQLSNDDINPLADTDAKVRALTRDSESSLSIVLTQADGGVLGESRSLDNLEPWERRELLSLASISVPASWVSCLKGLSRDEDDGVIWLPMSAGTDGSWVGYGHEARFLYSAAYGLEREQA